jgi:hypothetical protein
LAASPDVKFVKNREHPDLNPRSNASAGAREAEIERISALWISRTSSTSRGLAD